MANNNKILIVEDDHNLLTTLKYNLQKDGYDVTTAIDGAEAVETALKEKPDLIILDIMLPKINGFEVCRILRKDMIVPILMLTAKTEETDKVVGLEIGADDYMTKPFSMRELLARVRAMLRRAKLTESAPVDEKAILKVKDLEIDLDRHRVLLRNAAIGLTSKEFDLLAFLARNRGLVFNVTSFWRKCGDMIMPVIPAPWMYISAGCVRRLKPTREIPNTWLPFGGLVINWKARHVPQYSMAHNYLVRFTNHRHYGRFGCISYKLGQK